VQGASDTALTFLVASQTNSELPTAAELIGCQSATDDGHPNDPACIPLSDLSLGRADVPCHNLHH